MTHWAFEVMDKDGNTVRLSRRRWEIHVMEKHGEVEPYLDEIKEVIASPSIITFDSGGAYHLSTLGAVSSGRWRNL